MQILFDIDTLLRSKYNNPHYGNKEGVVDELVYILLSKRTNLKCNQKAFDSLKEMVDDWKQILDVEHKALKKAIFAAGLTDQKVSAIKLMCEKILNDFGHFDIKQTFLQEEWSSDKIYDYLISLPGIGMKSAYCVMLYSLKLPVMPADAHVIRVFHRLGLIQHNELQHHQAQKDVSALVDGLPWSMLYSLHVNMKAHGEYACKKQKCFRDICVIKNFCYFGAK